MSALPHLLDDYLDAVRTLARRRGVLALALSTAAFAVGLACLGAGVSAATLRGDLGASLVAIIGVLGGGTALGMHAWKLIESTRSRLTIARGIARTPGPLRPRSTTAEHARDAALRHEILGAAELAQALDDAVHDQDLDQDHGATGLQSPELAHAYVRRIGAITLDLDPKLALRWPRAWPRALALATALAALIGVVASPEGRDGFERMFALRDDRPPPPAQPVWTALEVELVYPAHTRRKPRRVPNPSGTLRAPAGTVLRLDMEIAQHADAARLVVVYDSVELAKAVPPQIVELTREPSKARAADEPDGATDDDDDDAVSERWTGEFVLRGAGTWIVALLDDPDAPLDPGALQVARRRSPPMRVELEPDAPPEVELLPLPDWQREATEVDAIDLRFSAQDDFGVVEAELVYEVGEIGEQQRLRLPAGRAPGGGARTWRHRVRWDLSAIPLESRAEVSYWIEVRDNDPGLGLIPLEDGPGKVAASARQQLSIHDQEAEHAENIADLQAIRDAAVDLLAERLTTETFEALDEPERLPGKLGRARDIHDASATLLTMLAGAVDALAMDTMVAERDVATLAAIHERLLELYRVEAELHEDAPAEARDGEPKPLRALLTKLGKHNRREVTQLEDEIIRLDDLVDGQIIARMEALMARLQASQQKLVEKLEQLAAGDESVRPQIEQLEQRIREDMRRVQEARAQLRKEVGDEWMNLDAFKAMEARMRSQALLEQLRNGDVEGALQQAREGLDAIRQMRDSVQQSASEGETPALSQEDQDRMKMLRELSRLQDEQTGLRADTQQLREQWRREVSGQRADAKDTRTAKRDAETMREKLEAINDARLSRDARTAYEDAREALERLEAAAENEQGEADALELFDAARDAADALERARAGATGDERKRLAELGKQADGLRRRTREPLPDPGEVLGPDAQARLETLDERQQTLRERTDRLREDPAASVLPDEGQAALDATDRSMRDARGSLEGAELDDALRGEQSAWQGIQRAIDSLRDASPPPPESSGGESSTEAERDRSLRDQVVEAMREGDRDGFDEDTKRYYEALLK